MTILRERKRHDEGPFAYLYSLSYSLREVVRTRPTEEVLQRELELESANGLQALQASIAFSKVDTFKMIYPIVKKANANHNTILPKEIKVERDEPLTATTKSYHPATYLHQAALTGNHTIFNILLPDYLNDINSRYYTCTVFLAPELDLVISPLGAACLSLSPSIVATLLENKCDASKLVGCYKKKNISFPLHSFSTDRQILLPSGRHITVEGLANLIDKAHPIHLIIHSLFQGFLEHTGGSWQIPHNNLLPLIQNHSDAYLSSPLYFSSPLSSSSSPPLSPLQKTQRAMEILTLFHKHDPSFVHLEDNAGNTPLHLAVRTGNVQIVRHLLTLGANPEHVNNKKSSSLALCVAHLRVLSSPLLSESTTNSPLSFPPLSRALLLEQYETIFEDLLYVTSIFENKRASDEKLRRKALSLQVEEENGTLGSASVILAKLPSESFPRVDASFRRRVEEFYSFESVSAGAKKTKPKKKKQKKTEKESEKREERGETAVVSKSDVVEDLDSRTCSIESCLAASEEKDLGAEREEREDVEDVERRECEDREESDRREREEKEKIEREEAERQLRAEREETERQQREEREETERQQREEMERQQREEAERQEREEAERQEREEAERQEREEAERQQREEEQRQQREETERQEREREEREERERRESERVEFEEVKKEWRKQEDEMKKENQAKIDRAPRCIMPLETTDVTCSDKSEKLPRRETYDSQSDIEEDSSLSKSEICALPPSPSDDLSNPLHSSPISPISPASHFSPQHLHHILDLHDSIKARLFNIVTALQIPHLLSSEKLHALVEQGLNDPEALNKRLDALEKRFAVFEGETKALNMALGVTFVSKKKELDDLYREEMETKAMLDENKSRLSYLMKEEREEREKWERLKEEKNYSLLLKNTISCTEQLQNSINV